MRTISSGTIDYYEEDMLGSSRTMVQAGQTSVCFDADFLPFGYEKDVTTTCTQSYKFESKERDTETLNDDFGARYYTFRLGRWLSADWSSVPAPVPYANLTNPQTLNLYAMVSDNPESFADLDGHCDGIECVFTAVDFVVGVVRGAAASLSFGSMPAANPSPSDSTASRLGQDAGTLAVGIGGASNAASGTAETLAVCSTGGGCAVAPATLGQVAVGTEAMAGAVKNAAALLNTPMQTSGSKTDNAPGSGTTTKPSSAGKMQKEVEKGQAPKSVDRVDKGRGPHEQDHVHFTDGSARNQDGSWKHGSSVLPKKVTDWLEKHGWN
jgi:RHS repeat-associated protein